MEKTQFDTLMLAIGGLNAKFEDKFDGLETKIDRLSTRVDGLDTKFDRLDAKMDSGFAHVRKDLEVIREQVAHTHVMVTDHEHRISKLEGPHA